MLNGNIIIWSKYRWNIKKWIFGMLMSLIFQMKKLRNLHKGGVRTWLM